MAGDGWMAAPARRSTAWRCVTDGEVLRERVDGSVNAAGYSLQRLHEGWHDPLRLDDP